MMSERNRRESFRMDDVVRLRFRIPDEKNLTLIEEDFYNFRIRYCLKSQVLNQQQDMLPRLKQIRRREPEMADYLEHLERQIVYLADRMIQNSNLDGDKTEVETRVNLSATGIRFQTDKDVEVGQRVELGMLLSTSAVQVVALADVVRVEPVPSTDRHSVSFRFSHIHPDDSEAIIRHLAKLQSIQLQARRFG